jgi:AraC-like DNA-binding protein
MEDEQESSRVWESLGLPFGAEPGAPFCAREAVFAGPWASAAFDWLEVVVARAGTGWCRRGDGRGDPVRPGSVVFLAPNTPCVLEPEGRLEVTRLFYSVDFIVEQVRWQHHEAAPDMWAARVLCGRLLPDPLQVVGLDGADRRAVSDAVGGLAGLSRRGLIADRHFEALSLASVPLAALAPRLAGSRPGRLSRERGSARRPTLPCVSALRPAVEPVRRAREWIEAHCAERWTVADVAREVCVSRAHLARRFQAEMGKTPMAYRDALRVHAMVALLIETPLPVGRVCAEAGWGKPGHAAAVFRKAVGIGPSEYRRRFRAEARV